MTHATHEGTTPMPMTHADALPDPAAQPEFYESVQTKRLVAWLIDGMVVFTLAVIVSVLTVFVGFFFFPLVLLAIGFVYRTATIANGGGTWGMRVMAIELRGLDGRRPDLATAAGHTFLYAVSMGMFFVQALSVLLMLGTERGQGLGDFALGTAMVNRRATR